MEYKYVRLLNNGSTKWEGGGNRTIMSGSGGSPSAVSVEDTWNDTSIKSIVHDVDNVEVAARGTTATAGGSLSETFFSRDSRRARVAPAPVTRW